MIETSAPSVRYHQGERVALFLPCYCDALFPQVGIAAVRLFERLGVRLEYPMEQTCCGQPAFNAGLWPEAAALARRFARVFDAFPWIVVPSGSCGAMTRVFYSALAAADGAAAVGARVYDLATFLVDVLGLADVGARFAAKVAFHEGCHARRELRAHEASIALLRAVKDLDYIELPRSEECCGFGGLFSVKYPELSVSMGEAKRDAVLASHADVLASGDSSCLMHIEGLFRKHDPRGTTRFMHLAEILASDG
jgi:L-lactate dehydrogenase complex protein LldE